VLIRFSKQLLSVDILGGTRLVLKPRKMSFKGKRCLPQTAAACGEVAENDECSGWMAGRRLKPAATRGLRRFIAPLGTG
jgi:hypothetical protein